MEHLPRIPSPPSHHWREFRIRFLPAAVFVIATSIVVLVWKDYLAAPVAEGEVEAIRSDVTTLADGTLQEVRVQRFDEVTTNDTIAVIARSDPRRVKAALATIGSDLQVMRARMLLDAERNVLNHEQLRLDLLSRRIELAEARIQLRQAESEYHRVERLYQAKVTAAGINADGEGGYEVALRDRDALRTLVEEKTKLVADLEGTLQRVQEAFPGHGEVTGMEAIAAALAAQERELRLMEEPVELKAPLNGVVGDVLHQPGEKVMAGTIIATISATESRRIIGYIRQPLAIEPQKGMPVEIRTRGPSRQAAVSHITRVGSEMQLVARPLRIRGFDNAQERGLAFVVDLPPELRVRPGELVDLILHSP